MDRLRDEDFRRKAGKSVQKWAAMLAKMTTPDDAERRVLLPAKNDIGEDVGYPYRLVGDRPGVARPDYEDSALLPGPFLRTHQF